MATDAEKVAKYREMAKDKTLPQDVRNAYLDKANELEVKSYEATKALPPVKKEGEYKKGGMVKKPVKAAKPVKKMMAKGGMAKKGK